MCVLQQPFKMYGLLFLNGSPVLKIVEIITASIKIFIIRVETKSLVPYSCVIYSKLDVSFPVFFISYIFLCRLNHKKGRKKKEEASHSLVCGSVLLVLQNLLLWARRGNGLWQENCKISKGRLNSFSKSARNWRPLASCAF